MKLSLMKKTTVLLLCLFTYIGIQAQQFTISGYIKDAQTGELLIGANVYDSITYQGTITNSYGFYSLTLPAGEHNIMYSFVGYHAKSYSVNLNKDMIVSLELYGGEVLDEVVVSAEAKDHIESTQMSMHKIRILNVKKMPALFGEVDIMKSIQKLPGVQSANEASSGVYVRGGSPSQNLILLDGVPVYNVNHLFGLFSVFNADAINSVSVVKGGFPARYGGRISSVIDIRLNEGNMKKTKVEGGIGILSSNLTVSGPIKKDTTSYMISGRRSYFDLFTRAYSASQNIGTGGYWFGDLNAKINHIFSPKDRLYLSFYMGQDEFFIKSETSDYGNEENIDLSIRWGNITSALRWNHIFSSKLFSNTTVTYSRFRFLDEINVEYKESFDNFYYSHEQEYFSGVYDWAVKLDMDYYPNTAHQIKYGAEYTYHSYEPGVNTSKTEMSGFNGYSDETGNDNIYAHEMAAYIEDNWEINSVFQTNIGARYSSYFVNNKYYQSLEPRASLRTLLSENLSMKTSVANMKQYIHLLSNSSITLPTDLWVPATEKVPPQISWQYALGFNYIYKRTWKMSLEGYYKEMDNVISYKEGTHFIPTDKNWQDKVASGKGWSYGLEFMVEKEWERTNISLAYTLSWTNRQFDEINNGNTYPYKYDRRHDINVSFTHKFNERIDMGVNWIFATGNAFTVPFETYSATGDPFGYTNGSSNVSYYKSRNNYRAPAYHRLDVGVNFHKQKKWGERTWMFSMFNAYGRYNPVFMMIESEPDGGLELYQITLFRFVPSITYRFKFN
jgi:outer membrane receptor for ferrienterochelin and colicin